MKKTILMLAMIIGLSSSAQLKNGFVSIGFDTKMAIKGPAKTGPNAVGPTYNLEFKTGWEWEKQRLAIGWEIHQEIHYQKWFIELGHKVNEPFGIKNITAIAAGEFGIIHRDNQNVHFTKVNNYRENDYYFSFGVVGEIIWYIPGTDFGIGASSNLFLSESKDAYGNDFDKPVRIDGFVNLHYRF